MRINYSCYDHLLDIYNNSPKGKYVRLEDLRRARQNFGNVIKHWGTLWPKTSKTAIKIVKLQQNLQILTKQVKTAIKTEKTATKMAELL